MPSNRDAAGRPRWVDLQSAVSRTGLSREHIVWAMASGEVRYSTSLTDHEGVPRLSPVSYTHLTLPTICSV